MYCRNCGKQIDDKAVICVHCGVSTAPQPQYQYQPQPIYQPVVNVVNNVGINDGYHHKSKWVAFMLCLLFGIIGAHRFYVGKVGTGLIYLFTCGLGGVGWLIDLVVILFGGFKDKYHRHLR